MDAHALFDPLPGSNSFSVPTPGWSSLSRLDPGLISPIPAGIKSPLFTLAGANQIASLAH